MTTPGTTFTWPRQPRSSWALAGFIFLSLILHSAAFFLFQTAAPQLTTPPRKAYPVQLLTRIAPDGTRSLENEELLRWVEANDPAIVARIPTVEPEGLLDIPYRPSFATLRTPPLDVPAEPDTVQFPPARDPMALIRSADPPLEVQPLIISRQATSLAFPPSLAARIPGRVTFAPAGKSPTPIEATKIMLGVTAEGEVRFTFIQRPGGVPTLDQEAVDFLTKLRFEPSRGTEWGIVTVNWGDDIAK